MKEQASTGATEAQSPAQALWDALLPLLGEDFLLDAAAGRLPLGAGIKEATVAIVYAIALSHVPPSNSEPSTQNPSEEAACTD